MLLDAPGRLPARAPVTAVVDADHAVRGEALLGQPAEPAAVARDAVEADDRLSGRVSPLGDAQLHVSTSLPKCAAGLAALASAVAASASGWTESITGRHEPRPTALRKPFVVRRAAHQRAEQRLLAGVERAHRQRRLGAARGAEDDEPPAGPQALERLRPRRADGVDDEVGAAELLHLRHPVARGVVDATLGTERARALDLLVRRRGDEHARTGLAGELDDERRDAAAGAEHEHRLAGDEPAAGEQCPVRGQARERHRGRLLPREPRRLREHVRLGHGDELGVGSVARTTEDLEVGAGSCLRGAPSGATG